MTSLHRARTGSPPTSDWQDGEMSYQKDPRVDTYIDALPEW